MLKRCFLLRICMERKLLKITLDGFFYSSTLALSSTKRNKRSCMRHSYENYASNTPKGRQKRIKNLFKKHEFHFSLSNILQPKRKKEGRRKRSFDKEQNTIKKEEYYYHIHIFTWTVIFMYIVYGKKQSIQQFVPRISPTTLPSSSSSLFSDMRE